MDEQLIEFMYKWHRLEEGNNVSIIDFDLIQQGAKYPGIYKDRQEVKYEILRLQDLYDKDTDKIEFIADKLRAAEYYLRALMGEEIPFDEYVFNTMGVQPKLIPEEEIEEQKQICMDLMKALGYGYSKEEVERYTQENLLDKGGIEKSFKEAEKDYVPKLLDWLELNVDLHYSTEYVQVDDYWRCWVLTDLEGNIKLMFNINPDKVWRRGLPEIMVLHELCSHAIQCSSWKKQVQKDVLSPFLGLTSTFSPEAFNQEGIGNTLWLFYPEQLYSEYGLLGSHLARLSAYCDNNAHIMINQGKNTKEILEFLNHYLPGFKSDEARIKSLEWAKIHPLNRTYMYVYGIAEYYLTQLAQKSDSKQKKEFVQDIYTNVYTPTQLLAKYDLTGLL